MTIVACYVILAKWMEKNQSLFNVLEDVDFLHLMKFFLSDLKNTMFIVYMKPEEGPSFSSC